MKAQLAAALAVPLAALLLLTPAGSGAVEPYGYSVSSSPTDPYENTAAPGVGLYDLYIWLDCTLEGQPLPHVGGMDLTGTLLDRYLGVEGIGPIDAVTEGPVSVAWSSPGPVVAPAPLLVLHFFDPAGTGGTLCLAGVDPDPMPVGCYPQGFEYICEPAAARGFASDGSAPCLLGSCLGPVDLEGETWGRLKSLYR